MDATELSELKKVLKEEFVVWRKDNGRRCYVCTVYVNSVSTTSNIDDAMKVTTLETAKALACIANTKSSDAEYHISHIQTIIEDCISTESTEF